jgi:hypothetical protein
MPADRPSDSSSSPANPGRPMLDRVFVLKLVEDPASGRLAGRLEHVISGREQDFGSVQELLAALQQLCRARTR